MEPKFEVALQFNRRLFYEFGNIANKRNKASLVLWICSLVFLFVFFPVALVLDNASWTAFCVFFGVWTAACSAFQGRIIGYISFRNMNKTVANAPVSFTFDEEFIYIHSAIEDSRVRYAVISEVCESNNLFALFIHKGTAYLLPKEGFVVGSPEEFRHFIAGKIEKPLRFIPYKRKVLPFLLASIGIAAWITVLLIGNAAWKQRPATFTTGSYSIELTSNFRQASNEGYFFSAYTKDIYVLTQTMSTDEMLEIWDVDSPTAAEFANLLGENIEGAENVTVQTLENGTVCLAFTNTLDDRAYYYCDTIFVTDNTYWITEFICAESRRSNYEEKFLRWAQSVRVQ